MDVPLTFGKETGFTKISTGDTCDMENFERLSDKVLIRTCTCGIVFETYDPRKVYHSNICRTNYVRKRNGVNVAKRRKLKQKRLKEQSFH